MRPDDIFQKKPTSNETSISIKGTPTIKRFIEHEIFEKAIRNKRVSKIIRDSRFVTNLYIEVSELIRVMIPEVWDANSEFLKNIFGVDDINILLNGSPIISRSLVKKTEFGPISITFTFFRKAVALKLMDTQMVSCDLYYIKNDDEIFSEGDTIVRSTLFTPNRKDVKWAIKTLIY